MKFKRAELPRLETDSEIVDFDQRLRALQSWRDRVTRRILELEARNAEPGTTPYPAHAELRAAAAERLANPLAGDFPAPLTLSEAHVERSIIDAGLELALREGRMISDRALHRLREAWAAHRAVIVHDFIVLCAQVDAKQNELRRIDAQLCNGPFGYYALPWSLNSVGITRGSDDTLRLAIDEAVEAGLVSKREVGW